MSEHRVKVYASEARCNIISPQAFQLAFGPGSRTSLEETQNFRTSQILLISH